jgi:hypothetical protein
MQKAGHGAPISPRANFNMGAPVTVYTVSVNSNKALHPAENKSGNYLK